MDAIEQTRTVIPEAVLSGALVFDVSVLGSTLPEKRCGVACANVPSTISVAKINKYSASIITKRSVRFDCCNSLLELTLDLRDVYMLVIDDLRLG